MPNVEFSEERAYSNALDMRGRPPAKGLRALVLRLGLAKDETGADIILSGVAILATILAVIVFFYSTRITPTQRIPTDTGGVPLAPNPGSQL